MHHLRNLFIIISKLKYPSDFNANGIYNQTSKQTHSMPRICSNLKIVYLKKNFVLIAPTCIANNTYK